MIRAWKFLCCCGLCPYSAFKIHFFLLFYCSKHLRGRHKMLLKDWIWGRANVLSGVLWNVNVWNCWNSHVHPWMPNEKFIARFEVLVVLLLNIRVFWDVTLVKIIFKGLCAIIIWVKLSKKNRPTGKFCVCYTDMVDVGSGWEGGKMVVVVVGGDLG